MNYEDFKKSLTIDVSRVEGRCKMVATYKGEVVFTQWSVDDLFPHSVRLDVLKSKELSIKRFYMNRVVEPISHVYSKNYKKR